MEQSGADSSAHTQAGAARPRGRSGPPRPGAPSATFGYNRTVSDRFFSLCAAAVAVVAVLVLAPRAARANLTDELGPGFSLLKTDHYSIAYDTDREFARFHGRLFEATFGAFVAFFEASGFALTMPSERLDVVLFESERRFRRYADDYGIVGGANGFYSIGSNRIAFYDAFDDANYRTLIANVRERERELDALKRSIAGRRRGRVRLQFGGGGAAEYSAKEAEAIVSRKQTELLAERRRLQTFFEERNLTTTIHECVHQLAFNLGVQNRFADNPTWLAEGLATYFETSGYAAAGPSGLRNPERYEQYRAARSANALIPLVTLLTDDGIFRDADKAKRLKAYGQSWALFRYLSDARPVVFYEYLRVIAAERRLPDEAARKARRLELFRAAFGEHLGAFERAWHAHADGALG